MARHQSQSLTITLMCACGEEFTTQVYDEPEEAMTRVQIRHAVHEAEHTWVQG